MQASSRNSKKSLLSQIKDVLSNRMSAKDANQAAIYSEIYFRRVPLIDMGREAPVMHATMVARQLDFLRQRKPGELLLQVFNTGSSQDGWECSHTIVELANDDMPFLVDTASMVMHELNIGVHLIVHPVLNIERDGAGKFKSIHAKATKNSQVESFLHIHIDKQTDSDVLASIESLLLKRMAMVRTTVEDWPAMKVALKQAISTFGQHALNLPDEVQQECVDFLRWADEDHFMFIGARSYDIVEQDNVASLKVVEGTGLGLLRVHGKTILSRPLASLSGEARYNQTAPLIITKTNTRSPMHRSGYMDYVGVLRFDAKGKVIGEYRFIGLFTSQAYLQRVADTPLVSMKVNTVLENSGLRENRHAWKTLLHILETLPRDDVLQASSTDLLEIATGVLDLQERQTVRLFIRRERFGRFFSCLVYIPRDHWNTENREKIQRILKRALKGDRLDYMIQLSESTLARLQVIIRPKPGSDPEPDVRVLENKIINALRS